MLWPTLGLGQIEAELKRHEKIMRNPQSTDSAKVYAKYRFALYWTYVNSDSGLFWARMVEREAEVLEIPYLQLRAIHFQSIIHTGIFNFDSAIYHAKRGLDLAIAFQVEHSIGDCYQDIGNILQALGKTDSARFYYLKALYLSSQKTDAQMRVRSMINLCELDLIQGNYLSALNWLDKAEEISDSVGFTGYYPSIYYNYAELYNLQNDYIQALNYYRKSLYWAIDRGNKHRMGNAWLGIGKTQIILNEIDSGYTALRAAYNIHKTSNHRYNTAIALLELGIFERDKKNFDSAFFFLHQAAQILNTNNIKKELYRIYYQLALTYFELKQFETAKEYLLKCLQASAEAGDLVYRRDGYELLYQIASIQGRSFDELAYLEIMLALDKQLFDRKKMRELALAQSKKEFQKFREFEKNENDSILQVKETLFVRRLRSEQQFRNVVAGAGVVFLLLSLISFVAYRFISNKNKQLAMQKHDLEISKKNIEHLNTELQHRVKNNLQIISSLLEMQAMKAENSNTAEVLREGQARIKSMELLHRELYGNNNFKEIDLSSYLSILLKYIQSVFGSDINSEYHLQIADIKMEVDRAISVGLIVNELATNSFKYASKSTPKLCITLTAEMAPNKLITFLYKDNGAEPLPEDIAESKTGIGLPLIASLVRQLRGKMQIETLTGFKITFEIPNP
jgi:two-component sensor histidine kinase